MNNFELQQNYPSFLHVCQNELFLPQDLIDSIVIHYEEKHRFYHNLEHIETMLTNFMKNFQKELYFEKNNKETKRLFYKILFHDIVYDPKSKTNEIDSAKIFETLISTEYLLKVLSLTTEDIKEISRGILTTINHELELEDLGNFVLCKLDLWSFTQDFSQVLKDEKKIRKEYGFVDWCEYQKGRVEVLNKFLDKKILEYLPKAKENIKFQIEYLKQEQPRVAIYPGSFKPFHIGHQNILEKAEKMFDKVIVAFGNNPEKEFVFHTFHSCDIDYLKYKQVDFYTGSLVKYINSKEYPVTVIRGLRNTTDMQYELNQFRWLQEISENNINMVSIFCDKEHEHISSSALRTLENIKEDTSKYIVK